MWVQNYPIRANLPNSGPCAEDFYNTLEPNGAVNRGFKHGDTSASSSRAHDTDIQEEFSRLQPDNSIIVDTPGQDGSYAEKVDMLYFCGHGDANQLYFGEKKGDAPNSDDVAHYDDIKLGDGPLKWLVLDACRTLHNTLIGGSWSIFNRWTKAFKPGGGLRYILGFSTTCKNDNFRGKVFAQLLNPVPGGSLIGEPIRIAWRYACEETEPNASEWAILRVGDQSSAIANDRWTDNSVTNMPTIPASGKQKFTYQKRLGPVATTPEVIG